MYSYRRDGLDRLMISRQTKPINDYAGAWRRLINPVGVVSSKRILWPVGFVDDWQAYRDMCNQELNERIRTAYSKPIRLVTGVRVVIAPRGHEIDKAVLRLPRMRFNRNAPRPSYNRFGKDGM